MVLLKNETIRKTQFKAKNKKKISFRIHIGEAEKDVKPWKGRVKR